jgi:hypothetical protein
VRPTPSSAVLQVGYRSSGAALNTPGSPIAEFFSLTADQMREQMLESGVQTAEQLDHALGLLNDPKFWAFGGGEVAVWVNGRLNDRKPIGRRNTSNETCKFPPHHVAWPRSTLLSPNCTRVAEIFFADR